MTRYLHRPDMDENGDVYMICAFPDDGPPVWRDRQSGAYIRDASYAWDDLLRVTGWREVFPAWGDCGSRRDCR